MLLTTPLHAVCLQSRPAISKSWFCDRCRCQTRVVKVAHEYIAHKEKDRVLQCPKCEHQDVVAEYMARHIELEHNQETKSSDIDASYLRSTEKSFTRLAECDYCRFRNYNSDVVKTHQIICELEHRAATQRLDKESIDGDGYSDVRSQAASLASDNDRLLSSVTSFEPRMDEFSQIDFDPVFYGDVVGTKETSIECRRRLYLQRDLPPSTYVCKQSIDADVAMKVSVVLHPQDPERYRFPATCGLKNPKHYRYMATMMNTKTRPAMVGKVLYIDRVAEGYFWLYHRDRNERAGRLLISQDFVFTYQDVCMALWLAFLVFVAILCRLSCHNFFHCCRVYVALCVYSNRLISLTSCIYCFLCGKV